MEKQDRPCGSYYRLSKQEQVKPGVEDSHRYQIERAIVSEGETYDRTHCYHDIMTGRKNQRPDFQRLLAAVRAGKYKAVFLRLDRMSRDAELFHEIERTFRSSSTRLYDLGKGRYVNFDDPRDWGDYHRAGVQAQEESLTTGYRIKLRKEFTRSQGKVQGGRMPLGFRRSADGYYEIDPSKRDAAIRAIEIYFESNCSAVEASRRIGNELGITISYQGLINWLKSPVLRGHTPYWGRKTNGTGDRANSAKRIPEKILWHTHTPLIDDEMAKQIDLAIAQVKRVYGKRASNRVYPLSGLLFCGRCGATATITSMKKNGIERAMIHCSQSRKGLGCGGKVEPGKVRKGIGTRYMDAERAVVNALRMKAESISNEIQPEILEEPEEAKRLRSQIRKWESLNDSELNDLIQEKREQLRQLLSVGYENHEIEAAKNLLIEISHATSDWEIFWFEATPPQERALLFNDFVTSVLCDGSEVLVKLRF